MKAKRVPLTLQKAAKKVQDFAHAPYSNFLVGCALEDERGKIFTGCNVENASYSITICAERVAISKMISEGGKQIRKLVIVTSSKDPVAPCGACRQMILEFGVDVDIWLLDQMLRKKVYTTIKRLMPIGFTEKELRNE